MQENWEKYKKLVDNKTATIAFNADFIQDAGSYEYMYVGFVKVELKHPREDGLVSKEELDEISMVEDRLEMEALRWRVGKYVGMINTNGSVTFVYYLKLDFEWSNAVSEAMKHFDYSYEYGSREDMQGEVYKKLLYPNLMQWQIINNHNTCALLQSRGDMLSTARAIEHSSFFTADEDAKTFVQKIEQEGFFHMQTDPSSYDEFAFEVKYFKKDVPDFATMDRVTLRLLEISQEHNGTYGGWECSVVTA